VIKKVEFGSNDRESLLKEKVWKKPKSEVFDRLITA